MRGDLVVHVRSSGPRGNAEIEREIEECMTRLRSLIREKVVAQLNLRVVDVSDVDAEIASDASDTAAPTEPRLAVVTR